MKSNEEVERLLNENSEINNCKINEMRDLMERYQSEKRQLEEKHSQSVIQLEVRIFYLIRYLGLIDFVRLESDFM